MNKAIAAACALSLLSCTTATVRADEVAYKKSRGMMIAGIVLTGVGLTLVIPGAAMIGAGSSCQEVGGYSCGEQGAGAMALMGGTFVGLGGSLVITGVPLWIVGASRMKRARQLTLAPTALTARF